ENIDRVPVLQEKIARKRPGEEIELTLDRNGKTINTTVKLKSLNDTRPDLAVQQLSAVEKQLGVSLEELTEEEKSQLGLENGLKVVKLGRGVIMDKTRIEEGFIITKVNDQAVNSKKDLEKVINSRRESGVLIEGIYPARPNQKVYEAFGF